MILCHKIVPLAYDDNGRMVSNTYCMKQLSHPGPCEGSKKENKSGNSH